MALERSQPEETLHLVPRNMGSIYFIIIFIKVCYLGFY